MQEPNRVHLEDRVYAPFLRLQVLEDVVREELHDVDERVRRCDPVLRRAPPRRDRDEQVDRRVLCPPILRLVRVVLVQTLPDPRARNLRGLRLVPRRDKGAQDVRGGLSAGRTVVRDPSANRR